MKKTSRKNIFRTYLLDIGFVLFLGFFLIFSRNIVGNYISQMNVYLPQINSIDPNLDPVGAEFLIKDANSISNNMFIFLLVIPVVVFLIYFIFQGLSFYYLKKEKKYLIYFFVTSLFSYILFALLLTKSSFNIPLILIFLLIAYLTFLSYLTINGEDYLKLLKQSYVLFFVFLGYLLLWIISFSLFLMAILNYTISNISYVLFAGLGLLVLLGISYCKILIVEKFS
ncbi:hypothetical protein HY500_03685 [Candidatus Woesearchaeota archaeon]|nr:hypothetical protein [Candidatus Woesearchaeota archaeon]